MATLAHCQLTIVTLGTAFSVTCADKSGLLKEALASARSASMKGLIEGGQRMRKGRYQSQHAEGAEGFSLSLHLKRGDLGIHN